MASHCGSLGLANRLHQGIWLLILNIYIGKIFSPLLRIFLFLSQSCFYQLAPSLSQFSEHVWFYVLQNVTTWVHRRGRAISKRQGDHLFPWGFTAIETNKTQKNPNKQQPKKKTHSKIMSVGTSPEHLSQIALSPFLLSYFIILRSGGLLVNNTFT